MRSSSTLLLRRVALSLAVLVVYRIGCAAVLPGVDTRLVSKGSGGDTFGLWSLFTGGPLTRASLFALGITPYLTAALSIQLLEVAVPALKQLKHDGVVGRARLAKITRTMGLCVAFIQAPLAAWALTRSSASTAAPAVLPANIGAIVTASIGMIAGFLACLWLAEVASRRGIGNGATLLVIASAVANAGPTLRYITRRGGSVALLEVLAAITLLTLWLVFTHLTFRNIPVDSARLTVLTRPKRTEIKLRLLSGGVTPLVFAASLLGIVASILRGFDLRRLAYAITNPLSGWHILVMAIAAFALTRLWSRALLDPVEIANDLSRTGKFLPGVEQGWPTARRLHVATAAMSLVAAFAILPIIAAPLLLNGVLHIPYLALLGTPLVITVVAFAEMRNQVTEIRGLDRAGQVLALEPQIGERTTAARSSVDIATTQRATKTVVQSR